MNKQNILAVISDQQGKIEELKNELAETLKSKNKYEEWWHKGYNDKEILQKEIKALKEEIRLLKINDLDVEVTDVKDEPKDDSNSND